MNLFKHTKVYCKQTLIIGAGLLLLSCQTAPKKISPSKVPPSLMKLFSKCGDADGGVVLSYRDKNNVVTGLGLDWIKEGSRFAAEVSSPVGNVLASLESDVAKKSILIKGQISNQLSGVSVEENGYFVIDGYVTGIKLSELSCFLSFQMPFELMPYLVRQKALIVDGRRKHVLKFEQDERVSWLSVYPTEGKACLKIKWFYYLGLMSQKVKVCQDTSKSPWSGSLEFEGGQAFEWVNSEN